MTWKGFHINLGELAQVLLAAAALVTALKGRKKLKEKADAVATEKKDE